VFRLRQDARAPNSSVARSHAPESGQFVLHPKVLDGNHMLPHGRRQVSKVTGVTVRRTHGDKGYRSHD
jgi:hypothetical protein